MTSQHFGGNETSQMSLATYAIINFTGDHVEELYTGEFSYFYERGV